MREFLAKRPVMTAEEEAKYQAEEEQRRQKEQRERQLARRVRLRVGAAIPEGYWKHLDAPFQEHLDAAREFIMDRAWLFLVLHGGVGCGKTVRGCVVLETCFKVDRERPPPSGIEEISFDAGYRSGFVEVEMGDRSWSPRFVTMRELALASSYDHEFFLAIVGADPLLIDDAGTEPGDSKGRGLSNVIGILSARYDHGRKTVITTNFTRDRFRTEYLEADGGRLADRFRETARSIVLAGPSRRKGLVAT